MSAWHDGKSVAEIIHEYAVVRGDLTEQYARDQLTQIIESRRAIPPAITRTDARAVLRYYEAYWGTLDHNPLPLAEQRMAKALSDTFGVPVDEDSFEAGS